MPLTVEVVSPEAILFTGEAEHGRRAHARRRRHRVPAPGHVSFLGALDDWPLRVLQEDGQMTLRGARRFRRGVERPRHRALRCRRALRTRSTSHAPTAAFEKAEAAMKADPEDLRSRGRRPPTRHVRLDVARAGLVACSRAPHIVRRAHASRRASPLGLEPEFEDDVVRSLANSTTFVLGRRGSSCPVEARGSASVCVEADGGVAHELGPAVGGFDPADRAGLAPHDE